MRTVILQIACRSCRQQHTGNAVVKGFQDTMSEIEEKKLTCRVRTVEREITFSNLFLIMEDILAYFPIINASLFSNMKKDGNRVWSPLPIYIRSKPDSSAIQIEQDDTNNLPNILKKMNITTLKREGYPCTPVYFVLFVVDL